MNSSGTSNARHPDEAALLKFLERHAITKVYIIQTVQWLKSKYPATFTSLQGELRKLYKKKQ